MLNLILLGAPGAGKGTQAEKISEKYGIPQISTGAILREAIAAETPLGLKVKAVMEGGGLVSDEDVIAIVKERLQKDDCKNGFILDGFPRNVYQAEQLLNIAPIDVVLDVDVPLDRLSDRLTGRRVCSGCGESYHVSTLEGRNTCAKCGENLYQRADDNEETVAERLNVYRKQTQPLIDFYSKKNLLKTVDGNQKQDEVFADVEKVLSSL